MVDRIGCRVAAPIEIGDARLASRGRCLRRNAAWDPALRRCRRSSSSEDEVDQEALPPVSPSAPEAARIGPGLKSSSFGSTVSPHEVATHDSHPVTRERHTIASPNRRRALLAFGARCEHRIRSAGRRGDPHEGEVLRRLSPVPAGSGCCPIWPTDVGSIGPAQRHPRERRNTAPAALDTLSIPAGFDTNS